MAIARVEPIQKGVRWWPFSNPINSVRRAVVAAFAVLVLILAAVAAGSAWMVQEHRSDVAAMDEHADSAFLLQDAQVKVETAAAALQRYVIVGDETQVAGDETLLPEIRANVATGLEDLRLVLAQAETLGDEKQLARLNEISGEAASLAGGVEQVIALRQSGDVQAMTTLETMVLPFREFEGKLNEAAQSDLQAVSALRSQSDRAGALALWLLVVSGAAGAALGVVVSIFVARSILRPLSSLEATAMTVAKGDMDARAPATGPRELAHLGDTMNYMMNTIQRHTEEIEERGRQLLDARAQAASDPLTGLGNHRKFHEKARDIVAAAQMNGTPVGLIMLDVDNFKAVNDALGHQAGDQVLRDVSATIAEIASQEQAYRYGGDEFTILLPDYDQRETTEVADKVLHAIEKRVVDGGHVEQITISVGVATFPDMAESVQELIYRADMALNWAKSAGKNRLGVWDSVFGRNRDDGEPGAATGAPKGPA